MRWLALTLALGACGSLVDGDYAGDPLFRLRATPGMISGAREGASVAVRWQGPGPVSPHLTRMPIESDFPAFWIDVTALPPREVQLALADGEPAFAEGYLHLVRRELDGPAQPTDFLASDFDRVLIYVAAPIAADALSARYLGAAFTAGYHVAIRSGVRELGEPQRAMVERCVAAAGALPEDRARSACIALHGYQLAPAPGDLDTPFDFQAP